MGRLQDHTAPLIKWAYAPDSKSNNLRPGSVGAYGQDLTGQKANCPFGICPLIGRPLPTEPHLPIFGDCRRSSVGATQIYSDCNVLLTDGAHSALY